MLRIFGMLAVMLIAYLLLHNSGSVVADLNTTRVDTILSSPRNFEGKTVTVHGIVTGGVGVMGIRRISYARCRWSRRDLHQLVSATGVPPAGNLAVTITGTFREAATIGAYQAPVIIVRP